MRFIVDAQLPPALVRWLVAKGHEAEHVADRQMATAPDLAIWDFALQAPAIIITKDEDFARRKVLTDNGPIVLWIRLPNTPGWNCSHGSKRSCPIFWRPWIAGKRWLR